MRLQGGTGPPVNIRAHGVVDVSPAQFSQLRQQLKCSDPIARVAAAKEMILLHVRSCKEPSCPTCTKLRSKVAARMGTAPPTSAISKGPRPAKPPYPANRR